MGRRKYSAAEKKRSFTRPMKCVKIKTKEGRAWHAYDFPVDEFDLSKKSPIPPRDLAAAMVAELMKPVAYQRQGSGPSCPGGLLKPPRYLPKVYIHGCTDSYGKKEMNQVLRKDRAKEFKGSFWPMMMSSNEAYDLWWRTKVHDLKAPVHKFPGYITRNRTEMERAKNRGVIIWAPGDRGRIWTAKQQLAKAKLLRVRFYRRAHDYITSNSKCGTRLQRDMAMRFLTLLIKGGPDDSFYDKDGMSYYFDNGMLENWGIKPGDTRPGPFEDPKNPGKPLRDKQGKILKNPIKFAEKIMIWGIRCADGVPWVAKVAILLVNEMNEGVLHKRWVERLQSKSVNAMYYWIMGNQSKPYLNSVYQCTNAKLPKQPNP